MSLKNRFISYCVNPRWTLGFIENPLEDIVNGKPIEIHYLKHSFKDRWFADPFILDVDDTYIYLLVEEYYDPIQRGRISKLTIRRNTYKLESLEPILELPTHLSFPAILREGNKIFIYPENADGEGLGLYEYNQSTDKCVHKKTISTAPLADAVITDLFGERFMFSTHIPKHNGNVLSVHRMEKWNPILYAECTFDSNVARNAGDWFKVGEKIYRPAQDCNETYGGAVIIQEVKRNSNIFSFRNIRRLVTTNPKYTTGLHTFNHHKNLSVIDVHGWRHNVAAKLLFVLIKLTRGNKLA